MTIPSGPIVGDQFVANGWTWEKYLMLYKLALRTVAPNTFTLQENITLLAQALESNNTANIATANTACIAALAASMTAVRAAALSMGLSPTTTYFSYRGFIQNTEGTFNPTNGINTTWTYAQNTGGVTGGVTLIGSSSTQWRSEVSEGLRGVYPCNFGASCRASTSAGGSFSTYLCSGFEPVGSTATLPNYPLLCFRLSVDAPIVP